MPYHGYVEPEDTAASEEDRDQRSEEVNMRVELVMALKSDDCGTFDSDEFSIPDLELLTTQNLIHYADRNGCSDVEYVINHRFREYIAEQERN